MDEILISSEDFTHNLKELLRVDEKKESNLPITEQGGLIRKIMKKELQFDFETCKMIAKTEPE